MKNRTGSCRRASDRLVTANRSSRLRTVVLSASLVAAATGLCWAQAWAQANSSASPTQAASAGAAYGGRDDLKTGEPHYPGGVVPHHRAQAAHGALGGAPTPR